MCCVGLPSPVLSCLALWCFVFLFPLAGFSSCSSSCSCYVVLLLFMASLCAMYNNKTNNKNTGQCKTENSQAASELGTCCVVLRCIVTISTNPQRYIYFGSFFLNAISTLNAISLSLSLLFLVFYFTLRSLFAFLSLRSHFYYLLTSPILWVLKCLTVCVTVKSIRLYY